MIIHFLVNKEDHPFVFSYSIFGVSNYILRIEEKIEGGLEQEFPPKDRNTGRYGEIKGGLKMPFVSSILHKIYPHKQLFQVLIFLRISS